MGIVGAHRLHACTRSRAGAVGAVARGLLKILCPVRRLCIRDTHWTCYMLHWPAVGCNEKKKKKQLWSWREERNPSLSSSRPSCLGRQQHAAPLVPSASQAHKHFAKHSCGRLADLQICLLFFFFAAAARPPRVCFDFSSLELGPSLPDRG